MKYLAIILSLFCTVPGMVQRQSTDTVTITVTIEAIRNSSGSLGVALYNEDTEFPESDPFKAKEVSLNSSGDLEVVFEDVPAGDYAIAVMHDENNNGDIDFNEQGMPLEGFGFSNDAMGDMGPPDFDQAAFTADKDTDVAITMIYIGGY